VNTVSPLPSREIPKTLSAGNYRLPALADQQSARAALNHCCHYRDQLSRPFALFRSVRHLFRRLPIFTPSCARSTFPQFSRTLVNGASGVFSKRALITKRSWFEFSATFLLRDGRSVRDLCSTLSWRGPWAGLGGRAGSRHCANARTLPSGLAPLPAHPVIFSPAEPPSLRRQKFTNPPPQGGGTGGGEGGGGGGGGDAVDAPILAIDL